MKRFIVGLLSLCVAGCSLTLSAYVTHDIGPDTKGKAELKFHREFDKPLNKKA
jgi:hypothetical protein